MGRLQVSGLAEQKHGAAMTSTTHVHPSDLFGFSGPATDATAGLADLVEAMHHAMVRAPGIVDRPAQGPAGGTADLAYETVREVTRLVGGRIDAILAPLMAMQGERHSTPEREAVLAALARDRSFRAFGRPPAPRTAAERHTLLHDCRNHSEEGRQPQSRVSRRRPGAPQQRIGPS
jgi:hypothetical protein